MLRQPASSAAGAAANSSSIVSSISSSSSNLPNYPMQLLGSYKALMHLLNCNRDSPAIGASTSTLSSATVAIIAAVASAAAVGVSPHGH